MEIIMKRILILFTLCFPGVAMALDSGVVVVPPIQITKTPSTSCPDNYIAIEEEYMTISNGTVCSTGYVSAGVAVSCLISDPGGSCIMYAPANVTYTDKTGSYVYTEACPMTDSGLVVVPGRPVRPIE